MVCKGTWSRIDLMSPKVFKYILFHLVFRGGSLSWRANSQELFFFFIKDAHNFSILESQLLHTGQLVTGTKWHV